MPASDYLAHWGGLILASRRERCQGTSSPGACPYQRPRQQTPARRRRPKPPAASGKQRCARAETPNLIAPSRTGPYKDRSLRTLGSHSAPRFLARARQREVPHNRVAASSDYREAVAPALLLDFCGLVAGPPSPTIRPVAAGNRAKDADVGTPTKVVA